MQKAISGAATVAMVAAQCCGGGGGLRACCGLGDCTSTCALKLSQGKRGKLNAPVIDRNAALKQCTKARTVPGKREVERTRTIMMPKSKKVRRTVTQKRLKTPVQYINKVVKVFTNQPFSEQRNKSTMDIEAEVQIPKNADDITNMVDEERQVTVTEMQNIRSMILVDEIVDQAIAEKKWGITERTGMFKQLAVPQNNVPAADGGFRVPPPTDEAETEDPFGPVVIPVVDPVVDPAVPDPAEPDTPDPDVDGDGQSECCKNKCNGVPACLLRAQKNKDPSPFSEPENLDIVTSYPVSKWQKARVTRMIPVDVQQQVKVTKTITVKVPKLLEGESSFSLVTMNVPLEVFTPKGDLEKIAGFGPNDLPIYAYKEGADKLMDPVPVPIEQNIQEPIYEYEDIEVPVWVNVVELAPTEEKYWVEIEDNIEEKFVDQACMFQLGFEKETEVPDAAAPVAP